MAGNFSNYTCLHNLGIETSIIRAYHSYGAIDKDAPNNILLSNRAGLSTDVYMFPCRKRTALEQVNELIDYLDSMKSIVSAFDYTTGMIWLDIETNPSTGCSWNQGSADDNCKYIGELLSAIVARKRSAGIYASAYMWN